MSIDPAPTSPDAVLPALTHRTHQDTLHPRPNESGWHPGADPTLCRECRQRPPHPPGRRGDRPQPDPGPAEADPDGPRPPSALMLDEIEARLAAAPRDDISGLRGVLWSYQRLLDTLVRTSSPEPAMRRQWMRLQELERRLRHRLRSAARRPPSR